MKKLLLIVVLALLLGALFAPAAQAFTWSHVGGDPLVPGGVWTTGGFSYQMLNNSRVRTALSYVVRANKQPSWVLPNARKELARGNIKSVGIARGTHLGAMSYGRYAVRVVKGTVYRGQYKKLPTYYVVSKQVTTKTIKGIKYRVTTSYWVSMGKPCGNVFIFHKRVTKKKIPTPPSTHKILVKKINYDTQAMIANWGISGTLDGVQFNTTTSGSDWVTIGSLTEGKSYTVNEESRANWTAMSPVNGSFSGVMGNQDIYLTFVNRYSPPPTPTPTPTPTCTPTPTPTPTCTPTPPPPQCYNIYAQKERDTAPGVRLGNWTISGTVGGQYKSVVTNSSSATLVGSFPVGTFYNLSETLQSGWEIVVGNHTGTMPNHDITLVFVNRYSPPPTPTPTPTPTCTPLHQLQISANYAVLEHLNQTTFSASFTVTVLNHTDNDALSFVWTFDGLSATPTQLLTIYKTMTYNTVHIVSVIATDAAGHTAQYTIPAFNVVGPSDPPPIPLMPMQR